jgi:hypothetical protein
MDILTAYARKLDTDGLVTFDPAGAAGDCFVAVLPDAPDEAVALFLYGGPETHAGHPYDEPRIQAQVRGTTDPRTAHTRAQAIYDRYHGFSGLVDDGAVAIDVIDCLGVQSGPVYLRADQTGRHLYVVNLRLELINPGR